MTPFQILLPCLAAAVFGISTQDEGGAHSVERIALVEHLDPEWIWCDGEPRDEQVAYFAVSIQLEQPAKIVDGLFTADNSFRFWIDGVPSISGSDLRAPQSIQNDPKSSENDLKSTTRSSNITTTNNES